jgi:hypothetical protein
VWYLGDAFLKNVYTAFRYYPPAVGFGELKPAFNKLSSDINVELTDGSQATAGAQPTPFIQQPYIDQPTGNITTIGVTFIPEPTASTGSGPSSAFRVAVGAYSLAVCLIAGSLGCLF